MKIQRQCPVCGVTYEAEAGRLKLGRQTTCSRSCSYRLRATQLENKVPVKCAMCGAEFDRAISQVKAKHGAQFCSPACAYEARGVGLVPRIVTKPYQLTPEGRAAHVIGAKKTRETRIQRDNYGHTQETISKLRDATARAIAEGRVPARSQLEKKVGQMLSDMGVRFVYQHPVRGDNGRYVCVFDFFLPEHKVVLEVNGTFWHADPRFFPDGPVHVSQKRNAVKWAEKLLVLDRLGYALIEAWEYDIKKEGSQYLARILAPVR